MDLNIKQSKRIRRSKEELKNVYVDPVKMESLINDFYKTNQLSDELAQMIYLIALRLALAKNFSNYSFRQEMQGDAVIKMMTALHRKRFRCNRGYNPFSYFTKIAYRAFVNRIKKEKRDYNTLTRYREDVYFNLQSEGYLPNPKNSKNYTNEDLNEFLCEK